MNFLEEFAGTVKQRGEGVELNFMARAAERGFQVSKPFGDSACYDVTVEANGRFLRIPVKSTTRRHLDGYTCRLARSHDKKYERGDLDFYAVYIIPESVWYILPEEVNPRGNGHICLAPKREAEKYRRYKEAWHLLREGLGQSAESLPLEPAGEETDAGLLPAEQAPDAEAGDILEMRGAVDPAPKVGFDRDLMRRRMAACFERFGGGNK
jgi:hypothetical protein